MYFPYFRGKQNELIVVRDQAELISKSHIIPIIEPVKSNTSPLFKAIKELCKHHSDFVLIVNPSHGDFKDKSKDNFLDTLEPIKADISSCLILGLIIDESTSLSFIENFLLENAKSRVAIIHYGHDNPGKVFEVLSAATNIKHHIFIEPQVQKLYRQVFSSVKSSIIIRDGFTKRNNRDYKSIEHFSDLHVTFEEEGANGFGDFLIVGDEYSESGGPAYAVALHLTIIDQLSGMHVKHYVSDRTESPSDPGGKFLEALTKLIEDLDEDDRILESNAVKEYRSLYKRDHFPGLGVAKKLSMQHHVELLANFLTGK